MKSEDQIIAFIESLDSHKYRKSTIHSYAFALNSLADFCVSNKIELVNLNDMHASAFIDNLKKPINPSEQ